MPRLLSVNVGLPRDVTWNGKTVRSAIWKSPVEGRRMARKLDIDGDAQGDLAGLGGEQRAVFVYQMDSYYYWERVLGRNDLIFGQFGENFTVEGLPYDEVCIGDRYRIGGAIFEVQFVTCQSIVTTHVWCSRDSAYRRFQVFAILRCVPISAVQIHWNLECITKAGLGSSLDGLTR
jgi:MOSC domain